MCYCVLVDNHIVQGNFAAFQAQLITDTEIGDRIFGAAILAWIEQESIAVFAFAAENFVLTFAADDDFTFLATDQFTFACGSDQRCLDGAAGGDITGLNFG